MIFIFAVALVFNIKIDCNIKTGNNNLREKERNLCKQLSHLTQVLQTIANTSIELGPCIDVTFKNLQCLYHLLGNFTKYFYAKSSNQNAAFQTAKCAPMPIYIIDNVLS